MAGSTSNLTQINATQASKEVTANGLFDAASPATLWGRNQASSTGLTWAYFGGRIIVDGILTLIANSTLSLTASTTNYIEVDRAGTVSFNTTGFTAGRIPLYTVVTGASTVTSWLDHRITSVTKAGRHVRAMADANQTLSAEQSLNDIIECTGALTAQRNLVVPLAPQQWTIFCNTTGFGIQVIGPSGTGVAIAVGKRAIVYSDGTNVVRVTPDT